MPLHVELVSQEKKLFEEPEADIVVLPGSEGEMGILPNHAPVLTALGYGEMVIRKSNAEERFAIYGGVVDVRPDRVVVLADTAESSYEIDMEKVEQARQRAAKLLEEGLPEDRNREAQLALRRAELALRVSRKIRSSSSTIRIVEENESS